MSTAVLSTDHTPGASTLGGSTGREMPCALGTFRAGAHTCAPQLPSLPGAQRRQSDSICQVRVNTASLMRRFLLQGQGSMATQAASGLR